MPRISTDNYDTVAAWNGSQDLFVVEQPDGTKVATPAMIKQFMEAGDFTATGEITDGHGNILKDMAKSADVNTALAGKQDTLTFDNAPTVNSNNPVKSGGVYTALTGKRSLTAGSAAAAAEDISTAIGSSNAYTTPHEGFVRVRGNASGETYLYIFDKLATIIPNFNSLISIWLPKGVPLYFDNQHYAPGLAQWFSCSND